MERTAENLRRLYAEHLRPKVLNVEIVIDDQTNAFSSKIYFYYAGEYAGFAEVYFGSDEEIIIANHQIDEQHQDKGSYKALCAAIPPIGRELGYTTAVISSTPQTETAELADIHERSGFTQASPTTMSVDISEENSAPERYARGE